MNSLINPKVIDILGVLKQGALSILSEHKTDIPTKPISETLATENQSQRSVDSQSVSLLPAIPKVKATQSAFVEKYEMGSGKNKINVCIFKEPTA